MEYFIKKQIGKNQATFVVKGENLYECITEAQKLSFGDVIKCGICKSDNLYLNARFAQKKFKYVEVKCMSCKGSLVFGCTMEDPNTYYLRKDKTTKEFAWKEYTTDENINE